MIKVKSHLRTLEGETFEEESRLAALGSFPGLDCRWGAGNFRAPQRVVEFIKKHDWASSMWQLGDFTYEGLRQEICKFWSDYAELKPEQIKIGLGMMGTRVSAKSALSDMIQNTT